MQRKKDNVALEIELLRARLGSKPSIKLAQVMAAGKSKSCKNFKNVGKHVKRVAVTKQEAKARLQQLVDKKEGGVLHHEFNDIRSTCKKLVRLELAKVMPDTIHPSSYNARYTPHLIMPDTPLIFVCFVPLPDTPLIFVCFAFLCMF
jgi:hypothetical protein